MSDQLPGGVGIPNPAVNPAMPSFQFNLPTNVSGSTQFNNSNVDFGDIAKLLSTPPQSMVNTALPAIAAQVGAQSQFIAPQIAAVRQRGEELAGNAQSDAMKRGMTGSDIEAAGMVGARQGAAANEADIRAQAGMQQAQTLAQAIMQAFGHDINANSEMFQNLAQLIGQKMSSDQNFAMFHDQLNQALNIAHSSGNTQLLSSLISGAGQGASYAMMK